MEEPLYVVSTKKIDEGKVHAKTEDPRCWETRERWGQGYDGTVLTLVTLHLVVDVATLQLNLSVDGVVDAPLQP
ncbi:hypothetical protein Tco_0775283 [Tanacetum coccineum]